MTLRPDGLVFTGLGDSPGGAHIIRRRPATDRRERGPETMKRKKPAEPRQQSLDEMQRVNNARQRAASAEQMHKDLEEKWQQRFNALAACARAAGVDAREIEKFKDEAAASSGSGAGVQSDHQDKKPEVTTTSTRWHDDNGLCRRFEIIGHEVDPMNGVFHLDGIFDGAARYRSCKRDDWWILKKGDIWRGCGHSRAERCTQIFLELELSRRAAGEGAPARAGRCIDGIAEIPDDPAFWTPARFLWVPDEHGRYDRDKYIRP
jgi:hypothetical protein